MELSDSVLMPKQSGLVTKGGPTLHPKSTLQQAGPGKPPVRQLLSNEECKFSSLVREKAEQRLTNLCRTTLCPNRLRTRLQAVPTYPGLSQHFHVPGPERF